jgi:hypothetical protein
MTLNTEGKVGDLLLMYMSYSQLGGYRGIDFIHANIYIYIYIYILLFIIEFFIINESKVKIKFLG